MQMGFNTGKILIVIMRNYFQNMAKVLLVSLLVTFSFITHGSTVKGDSLQIEVLLNRKMLGNNYQNTSFINSIDITSKNLVLLSTKDQFYLSGWGLLNPICNKVAGNISSYAYTSDNLLMVIRNKEICIFDSTENLTGIIKLPREGMGISAGRHVMYIFDRNKNQQKHSVYVIAQGGKFKKLFDSPAAIQSVAETGNSILFAAGSGLFEYNVKMNDLKALAVLPKGNNILSIAVDSVNHRIYFSSENAIYGLKGSGVLTITNDFGGILKFFGDGLMVLNTSKQLLIRISGLEAEIASKMPAVKPGSKENEVNETITNTNIVNLVKAELSDDLIIKIINKSDVNFSLSVDDMIMLSNQNVSSTVISAMRNAMKRKSEMNKHQ